MSTIFQQFTSDDTLIPIPNDMHTPITEIHRASIFAASINESFQKSELKVYELNKTEYFNKFVNSSLPSQQGKCLEENISLLKKNLCTKDEIIKKLVET